MDTLAGLQVTMLLMWSGHLTAILVIVPAHSGLHHDTVSHAGLGVRMLFCENHSRASIKTGVMKGRWPPCEAGTSGFVHLLGSVRGSVLFLQELWLFLTNFIRRPSLI